MPKLLKTPFAADAAEGYRTDIQESTGVAPNSATYQIGFPPNTMQSIAAGGMPPKGSDLNGVLYDVTDNLVFLTQGGGYGFDATYATAIGGYPLNARLRLNDGTEAISTIANNTNDPNVNLNGWVKTNSASQILDESGLSQQEVNNLITYTIENFASIKDIKVNAGNVIQTKGYYSAGDGGHGYYAIINNSDLNSNSYIQRIDGNTIAVLINQQVNDLRQFGIVISPHSTALSALNDYTDRFKEAIASGYDLKFGVGVFKITGNIPVESQVKLTGVGNRSKIYADMPSINSQIFTFTSGGSIFSDFIVQGNDNWYGEFCVFTGSIGIAKFATKNNFKNIRCQFLNLFARFTTNQPLVGSTHAMGSEQLFENCKVYNCNQYIISENIQAVNNWFKNCDFECDTTKDLATTVYIQDFAGGGINLSGGSIIGRGIFYSWLYPTGGTGLFQGANFHFDGLRFECRSVHSGEIIREGVHGVKGTSRFLNITANNITILTYGQTINVMSYAGRVNAELNNINAIQSNTLRIRQYPTIGESASSLGGGGMGRVVVNNSSISFVKEASSPYGTYNPAYTSQVIINTPQLGSTNNTASTDAYGFISTPFLSLNQIGVGINIAKPNVFLFGSDQGNIQLSAATYKFNLLSGMRLTKFGFNKPPSQHAASITVSLYSVKDRSSWVDSNNFSLSTDAYLLSSLSSPANSSGLIESVISPSITYNSTTGKTGEGAWSESRVAIVVSANTTGFFYIEYI